MVETDRSSKAHFFEFPLEAFQSSFTMAAIGTISSQGSSLPQEVDLDSKIFGKGKAQKSEEREKIRRKIDTRIGVVTQLSGDVEEDIEIALFIEAILAKNLLTMYCAERKLAKTGTKLEQIQRLMRHGWTLGSDEALQEDYARLQHPKMTKKTKAFKQNKRDIRKKIKGKKIKTRPSRPKQYFEHRQGQLKTKRT